MLNIKHRNTKVKRWGTDAILSILFDWDKFQFWDSNATNNDLFQKYVQQCTFCVLCLRIVRTQQNSTSHSSLWTHNSFEWKLETMLGYAQQAMWRLGCLAHTIKFLPSKAIRTINVGYNNRCVFGTVWFPKSHKQNHNNNINAYLTALSRSVSWINDNKYFWFWISKYLSFTCITLFLENGWDIVAALFYHMAFTTNTEYTATEFATMCIQIISH